MAKLTRRGFIAASAVLPFGKALLERTALGAEGVSDSRKNAVSDYGARRAKFAPALPGRELLRKHFFPNVPLITHEGKKVLFYDDVLKGKIVVLNLMYADCDSLCPTITEHLLAAQKILSDQGHKTGRDIFFYSITVKPEQDTPAKLKEYAQMHHTGPGWTLLTGKPQDVETLRASLGYVDPDPVVDKDKASHSGMVRYGNEPLCWWGACQGSAKPSWIAREISFAFPVERKKVTQALAHRKK